MIRFIGRGGMGQLYLARDGQLGRKVALKLVRSRRFGLLRFLQEARTTARFNHPNIVTVYAFGEYQGRPYLALEFLSGQTLRQRLAETSLGLAETLRIARAVASAMVEAHSHGVLHLDLKPANIVITREGRIKVLDFGLAQPMEAEPTEEEVDEAKDAKDISDYVVGTPAYMAPEQWLRRRRSGATDVWALGVILYELLTGRKPWAREGLSLSDLRQQVCDPAPLRFPESTELPDSLRDLVEACLVKDPKQRPTAKDVVRRLEGPAVGATNPSSVLRQTPFRGLLAFTAQQSDLFFGRDREIAEIVERLRTESALIIVGTSGAGKSSLVQAGVGPRMLEQGGWTTLTMRPGADPFRTLALRILERQPSLSSNSGGRGRAHPELVGSLTEDVRQCPNKLSLVLERVAEAEGGRVLLVVDQLEELFTMVDDASTRRAFLRALVGAADDVEGPIRVVLTVRDDFLARVAEAGSEVRSVLRRVMLLQAPESAAMADLLIKPVEAVGYRFESPEIVDRMIAEVDGKPAGLPLLQFAAQALWEHRDREQKLLTTAAYTSMRGVSGALAAHGDGVLDGLTETQMDLAKQILLRMVTSEETRRMVAKDRVLEALGSGAKDVLHRLLAARLVSTTRLSDERGTHAALELAHESLILTWGRLRAWIDEGREELRIRAELEQAARLWEQRGRRDDEVWTAAAVHEAERHLHRTHGPVSDLVTAFLAAGRVRERRRVVRRRSGVALGFAGLLLALVVVSVQRQDAVHQKNRAEQAGRRAGQKRAEAEREGATAAFLRGELFEARAKLRSSLESDDSLSARALWWQLSKQPLVWVSPVNHSIRQLAFHPGSGDVYARVIAPWVYRFDPVRRSKSLTRIPRAASFAFSPDGRFLALGLRSGRVELWDCERFERVHRFNAHERPPLTLMFSPNGRFLYSADYRGRLVEWDVVNVRQFVLQDAGDPVRGSAIGPDGRWLVTFGKGKVRLWDLKARKMAATWTPTAAMDGIAFDPRGGRVVTVGRDRTVKIWSIPTPRLLRELSVSSSQLTAAFSKDGQQLATAGRDNVIFLWDAETYQLRSRLTGHTGVVRALAFDAQGRYLASGGADHSVRLWDTEVLMPVPRHRPPSDTVNALRFSPDGRKLASGGYDQKVRLWDIATGTVTDVFGQEEGAIWDLDFTRDGTHLAWGSSTIRMADLKRRQPSVLFRGRGADTVRALRFDPSRPRLVAGSGTDILVYDVRTQKEVRRWGAHQQAINAFAITANGRTLASASFDRTVKLWDVSTGRMQAELLHHWGVYGVGLDGRGRMAVVATNDGEIYRWDLVPRTFEKIGRLPGLTYRLELSPDGRVLATSAQDGRPRLWDVPSGRIVRNMQRNHRGDVLDTALSPDGRWLASAGVDATVRVSNTTTGRPLWYAPAWSRRFSAVVIHGRWRGLNGRPLDRPSTGQWGAGAAAARWAEEAPLRSRGCLATFDDTLELWDLDRDVRTKVVEVGRVEWLEVSDDGCLIQVGEAAIEVGFERGVPQTLVAAKVDAVGEAEGRWLVVSDRHVSMFESGGRRVGHFFAGVGATAVAQSEGRVFLGYDTGQLAQIDTEASDPYLMVLQDGMPGRVSRLLAGPAQTLVVGAQHGDVGLWNLSTGQRLFMDRIHGPIVHLIRRDRHIYAVSELGWQAHWDLSRFEQPYCQLLEDVWRQVPVVWQDGGARPASPPKAHKCRNQSVPPL